MPPIEHPILFSAPMIRAILENRKAQTRRVVKPVRGFEHHNICKPDMAADPWAVWWHGDVTDRVGCLQSCPYGRPGDLLYVKEATWIWCEKRPNGTTKTGRPKFRYVPSKINGHYEVRYCADYAAKPGTLVDDRANGLVWRYKTGRFMPKWASRITLEITDIRAQHLQEISEEDAEAEGVVPDADDEERWDSDPDSESLYVPAFERLWDSINGKKHPWASNPWAWCVSFRRVEEPHA